MFPRRDKEVVENVRMSVVALVFVYSLLEGNSRCGLAPLIA